MVRPAEVAVIDEFLQPTRDRHEAVRERAHRDEARGLGRVCQPSRLRRRHRQRLLAEDVEAALDRGHRVAVVEPVRGEDDECVERLRCEQRIERVVGAWDAPAVGELAGVRRPCPDHAADVRKRVGGERRQVHRVRPPARPDDADPDLGAHRVLRGCPGRETPQPEACVSMGAE